MFLLFAFLAMTTNTYADAICPPGTQKVINEQTREVFCMATPNAMQTAQQQINNANTEFEVQKEIQNQYKKDIQLDEIHQNVIASGFEIQFGMGYALISAFAMHLKLEYSFAQPLDGMSFGLFTNCDLFIAGPNSLDWSAGPIVHINGNRFRGGLGLGLGIFHLWKNDMFGDYYDDNEHDHNNSLNFSLIPRIEADWFISKHFYLGFELDFPVIFYDNSHDDDDYYHDHENDDHPSIGTAMWFDFNLHVGYKF